MTNDQKLFNIPVGCFQFMVINLEGFFVEMLRVHMSWNVWYMTQYGEIKTCVLLKTLNICTFDPIILY